MGRVSGDLCSRPKIGADSYEHIYVHKRLLHGKGEEIA